MTVMELIEELVKHRSGQEVEVVVNGNTYVIEKVQVCTEAYPHVIELVANTESDRD